VSLSLPSGYRIPASANLPALGRLLTKGGRATRRDAMIEAVAHVSADLVSGVSGEDEVFSRYSHGQVGADDLSVTTARRSGIILRAAEFVDTANAYLHRSAAVPIPAVVDLSFSVQFFDDPDGATQDWNYALVATQCDPLHESWRGIRGVEAFPVASVGTSPDLDSDYEGWAERAEIWGRVLRPYHRSAPVRWDAPESAALFDLTESLNHPDRDAVLYTDGAPTIPAVSAEVRRLLAGQTPQTLDSMLLGSSWAPG
jgi:chorismate-pyruvate lyase